MAIRQRSRPAPWWRIILMLLLLIMAFWFLLQLRTCRRGIPGPAFRTEKDR
ncbi:MAG: hypothetical protein GX419_07305 [Bacteroidales bacterium]|nr:hypothetical protein [Bacteroidales bacterium]